jgi:glycosyltransferase involved in cell wall biosynthesis|tara:strand:+ start:2300 stop:2995 length:696 start_codon:yes stop_codon:yes gene_type:complete
MKLSIIIPCYNEIYTLEKILNKIKKLSINKIEVILVDDFSNDGTREIIHNKIKNKKLVDKILYHDTNLGKGAAIRTGIKVATGEIIIIQDADLEYDPIEYRKLIKPIIDKKADVVYGSRFLGESGHRVLYFWNRVANAILTMLSNIFTNINLTDMETGYKVFKADIIKNIEIEENRFGFEPEITAKISKLKCRIYEVGISYHGRTYDEGKKIGWQDAFKAIFCIFKYNIFR